MSLSTVEIPERMRLLPRDARRGVPIPWVTFIGADGVPDFRILDDEKKLACYRRRLCGLCGRPLDYWIVFVGGPLSVQNQLFADPAMHPACADYALAVCPYLVYSRARYSQRPLPDVAHADERQSSERPEVMYRYVTWQYEIVDVDGQLYAGAMRPKEVREFRGH